MEKDDRKRLICWLNTLKAPVLVVGNGVLAQPVPEEHYNSIIRINNYYLSEISGRKVTHWVTSGYKNIERKPHSMALIPWSSGFHACRHTRYDLLFADRVKVPAIHLESDDHILRWFPGALRNWKHFPSVGFCFLSWFSNYCQPDLIGFDGMQTGHQDNPLHRHFHGRTRSLEWELIPKFVSRIYPGPKIESPAMAGGPLQIAPISSRSDCASGPSRK